MTARTRSPSKVRRQAGLTLIELLVSLVILGFVVTVMSGAFYQVGQVQRVSEEVNGRFQAQWLQLRALSDLVGNLVLPEEGVERQFTGDANGFNGYSTALPQAEWGIVQKFQIRLEDGERDQMNLVLRGDDGKDTVLTSWNERVQFEYLAVDGSAQSIWPPFGKNKDALPSGVMIRAVTGKRQVQLVAPYLGVRQPERDGKKDMMSLFGMEAPK